MSWTRFFTKIDKITETRPLRPSNTPDFAGMALTAERYADSVLSRYVGEAHEELGSVLGELCQDLRTTAAVARRAPNRLLKDADFTFRAFEELIPYLNDYGVEDTKPLEDIRDKLGAWLRQQGRGQEPQPPSR